MPLAPSSSDPSDQTAATVAAFLSRARDALGSRSAPENQALDELFADGCAEALLLEAERRRLARRAATLAPAGDLAALRAVHAHTAAIAESVAELRSVLAELSERLPSRFARSQR